MGYMIAFGRCCGCRNPVSFNPETVPSYQGEPLCESCMDYINQRRVEQGMPSFEIPAGCYAGADA